MTTSTRFCDALCYAAKAGSQQRGIPVEYALAAIKRHREQR
jgi:hypothetical protein